MTTTEPELVQYTGHTHIVDEPSRTLRREFVNELGNLITMAVEVTDVEVIVTAYGPTSDVEHTWTRREGDELADMLATSLRPSGYQLAEREWAISQAALDGTAGDSIADRMREQDEADRRHEQRVAADDEAREERGW